MGLPLMFSSSTALPGSPKKRLLTHPALPRARIAARLRGHLIGPTAWDRGTWVRVGWTPVSRSASLCPYAVQRSSFSCGSLVRMPPWSWPLGTNCALCNSWSGIRP